MKIIKILLVLSTVFVTLLTALLLNYGAKTLTSFSIISVAIILLVLFINFAKFKVWGIVYRKYDLSESYPLVSLFFPLVYIVAIYNGEAILEFSKVFGVSLILIGTWIMNTNLKVL